MNKKNKAASQIQKFMEENKELFEINIQITREISSKDGDTTIVRVYFTGSCDSPLFHGTIEQEGCDTQEYFSDGSCHIRAEYTLVGVDSVNDACCLYIVNQKKGNAWKPSVRTDSKTLAWLNDCTFTAELEHYSGGLTVRIFLDDTK